MKYFICFLQAIFIIISLNLWGQSIPYPITPDWESAPEGHIATGLGIADINNDGWKDLVIANGNDIERQHLSVYYNIGDGTFPLTPDWQSDDIDYHGHLAVGDINLDGWIDVAVSVYIGANGFGDPGKVKVYYNLEGELEGIPSFESYNFYTFSCALGDADGDGDLDLATTGGEPYSSLYDEGKIFINEDGVFNQNPEWTSNIAFGSLDVDFADADQNGFMDVIFTSEETPNFIFFADDNGNISNEPSWQSAELTNYINSVDFGFTGSAKIPGIVMTGNDQLGGEGRVKLYSFDGGVPPNSSAIWTSEPFGYGSGILLNDVNMDGILDLIYGGWWLHVNIALGDADGFELNPSYTSSTNSVVEAIQIADLDRDGIQTLVETFSIENTASVIYLEKQLIENILSIQLNGNEISDTMYCYVPNKNWISFRENLTTGDEVIIEYEYSNDGDMVITNWDSQKGNYIFYNDPGTSVNPGKVSQTTDFNIQIVPNPASEKFSVNFVFKEKQFVEVLLTDITGKNLVKSYLKWTPAGKHSIEYYTDNLKSGIYILQFRSEKFLEIEKVVIK